ncbi:hypothetical protein KU75_16080 [Pectobacterium odoriferum]|uniref:Uncharacterized protein n=1 Tax=Pectobacterium odoriferum TaxID=78398 RepID=A0ABR4VMZ3_9GAMM|nr:hypothetical protein KU75_16080 [Pectobacterium odoriferum]
MSEREPFVAILGADIDDPQGVSIHLGRGVLSSDFATLCGLAGEGDKFGGTRIPLPAGAKVDCKECRRAWEACKPYRKSDFTRMNITALKSAIGE